MEKDLTKKRCLSDNERYADLINGFLFGGQQMVQACDLQDMDSQSYGLKDWLLKKKNYYTQRYRDIIKKASFGVNFAVIGVENQEEVHYLMPLRTMSYDASEYERQAGVMRKKVRREKGITRAEFLSGFRKTSRLYPCITLVLYFGEEWDGSTDLHGLLDFSGVPEEMKQYVNNYPIHIFNIQHLEDTDVFRTDLKQIFDFIRYSKDKNMLRKLVQDNPAYQEMDEDAFDMAVAYADSEELISVKKFYGKGGKVNMCKGLLDWMAEERQAGREEGREEGREAARFELIVQMYNDGDIILSKACARLGLTEEEFFEVKKRYEEK